MECSAQTTGHLPAPSPCGRLVASVVDTKLRIGLTHAPEPAREFAIRIPPSKLSGVRWSTNSSHVVLCSARHVEVVDLEHPSCRVTLDNGSGGLGRFALVEFLGDDQLLTAWEFGRVKAWNVTTGRGIVLGDAKTTCTGASWHIRPTGDDNSAVQAMAVLSRHGADDVLTILLPPFGKPVQSIKLPTVDAQHLSWSPDGRWLAILDTATASTSVRFYTPDGHLFRSYPSSEPTVTNGLGVKAVTWSPDSRTLALSRFDGRVVLLNTRTFAPRAMIEHATTIDQTSLAAAQQAPIWQEVVSASHARSYVLAPQPVSPPLSRPKPSEEPRHLGVAEARFSSDGRYLATRDERMPHTVWIWNVAGLAAHAVLIHHHHPVRRMHWHPTRAGRLLLDAGDGFACLFDAAAASEPPVPLDVALPGAPLLAWVPTPARSPSAILACTKAAFRLLYPDGREPGLAEREPAVSVRAASVRADAAQFDDGDSEDSLYEILSGRKSVPPRTFDPSYTEMVSLEAEAADGFGQTAGPDDTFREKRRPVVDESEPEPEPDPLDDSEIF